MDVKSSAVDVPANDLLESRELVFDEVPVAGYRQVVVQRLEEPEGRVDGVVLGDLARIVKRVRQHALIEIVDKRLQDLARLVGKAGGQRQPTQSDHGVPPPVSEPWVAGDDGPLLNLLLPSPANDAKLRCRQG